MSLSRLALRLAVVEALAPFAQHDAAEPAWPTAAAGRVLDSQLTPENFAEESARRLPVIAIFTDEAKTEAYGTAQDAAIDGSETVTLACEIMVPAVMPLDGEGDIIVPAMALDALAEATLDMIEAQIGQCLADARMSRPLCDVLTSFSQVESRPWRDADLDTRLSARRIEFSCTLRRTQRFPASGSTELDRLPSPLREVAQALPDGSYGASACQIVAESLGSAAAFTALAELRLAGNLARAEGDAAAPDPDASATPPVGDIAGTVGFANP